MFKGAKQECFHTYQPLTNRRPVPVIMTNQCRAKNKLSYQSVGWKGYDFKTTNQEDNKAAAWYGFARVGLRKCGGK